ncbi:Coagulation factor 5 8 type C terminal [Fasciola hepatica]|uniref:Coagulation factor 5 8 type C terminal n=1 Tax=Fasciola hepatica TaxID=6192 RepID=A0A4E0RYS7_FASHE|nr:Coagulation factor 5 8 type C terminal [Fasciola hepatica]
MIVSVWFTLLALFTMRFGVIETIANDPLEPSSTAHTQTPLPSVCESDDPLGMISGSIADWQITASSTYPSSWAKGCSEANARLFRPNGLAWCAKFKSSSEWLQIDLGVRALVTGIMTQGRGDGSEWVTSFMISYSDDATYWKFITDQYANQKIFEGNTDSFMVKHNYLDEPIKARFVKIHTYTWHNHPSLRVELVGCQPCKQLLGIPPYARFAASSSRGKRAQRSCMPEYGHYLSNKGWCPRRQDTLQWLQIDVGPPTQITGVIMKGRGDTKRPQYVTRFKLSYSNDTRLWYFYKDAAPLDPRVFEGNNDRVVERVHYLASPFIARYVRIHPIDWRSRIAMRVGLLGCRQKGPCSTGFFRINNESSCVANLAYKKSAWITPDNSNLQKRNLPDSTAVQDHQGDAAQHTGSNELSKDGISSVSRDRPRPPMLAHHRIGDSQHPGSASTFSRLPFWSAVQNGPTGTTMIGDTGDPIASLAVDGWTGEEMESRNSSLRTRSPENVMNDEPQPDKPGEPSLTEFGPPTIKGRHACVVLEYKWPFVELPSWYVDLREQTEVNGVVIYTAGHGRANGNLQWSPDEVTQRGDHIKSENLERLSVYVESEPRNHHSGLSSTSTSSLCGFVTRLNDAIYHPRLHIPCRQPLTGRFVYVEARGIRGRWSQEFSAMLCEVMVY